MTKEESVTIDDSRFNQITRDALSGREEEAARESGIDFERARELSERTDEGLPQIAAELGRAAEGRGWVDCQLVRGHRARPVIILQLTVRGVASVSSEGIPKLSDRFLVAVTIEGDGDPEESKVQILNHLTPIWHPQVSPSGKVTMVERPTSWPEVLEGLRRLISYDEYDYRDRLINPAAAEWAREHESLFPFTREHS